MHQIIVFPRCRMRNTDAFIFDYGSLIEHIISHISGTTSSSDPFLELFDVSCIGCNVLAFGGLIGKAMMINVYFTDMTLN